jgi:hypothetical protein
MEGRESLESQVSVRERISIALSEINSCKTAGLSSSGLIDDAERMLSNENLIVVNEFKGPGLSSTSPESKKQKEKIVSTSRKT